MCITCLFFFKISFIYLLKLHTTSPVFVFWVGYSCVVAETLLFRRGVTLSARLILKEVFVKQ